MKKMVFFISLLCIFGLTACIHQIKNTHDVKHLAWVTNEKDNNLMVVNLQTGRVIKTIPTGKRPHALVFTKEGKGYVNNRGEPSLTVIDAEGMSVLKTINLPATSMQLALSPDGKTLAVSYKDALKISLIDTSTDTIISTINIGPDQPDRKLVRIKHPFWSRDGRYVYAGDNLNHTVVKIDASTHRVVATTPVHATVHHFVTAPDGKIWIANGKAEDGSLRVTILDSSGSRVVDTITIPMSGGEKAKGHHGVFSPDGRFFYFCNEGGRTVAIIDVATHRVVKTLQAGVGAGHVYFSRDGRRAFVVSHHDNVVTAVDTSSQEVIKFIRAGSGKKEGHSGYVSEDGIFYMLNAADGSIEAIDADSLTLKSQIKVGRGCMIMVVR
jgi:YVTN family beta-propeller protein